LDFVWWYDLPINAAQAFLMVTALYGRRQGIENLLVLVFNYLAHDLVNSNQGDCEFATLDTRSLKATIHKPTPSPIAI
tara:strand:+ start:289 stop:522 length:234 start_codon:yes stop_codon:yes gene_type:complete